MIQNTEIHWEITNACNLRCRHCLLSSGERYKDELSYEEAITAVDKMVDAKVTSICFTGGEPFCYPYFLQLLEYTVVKGIQVQVVTNGTLLSREILHFLKKNGIHIGISLEGADEYANDVIRGKGTFARIIEILQMANELEYPVSLYVTANKNIIGNFSKIVEFALENKCCGIHVNDLTVDGRALTLENFIPDANEKENFIKELQFVCSSVWDEALQGPNTECWSDATTLFMTSEGNIYHCTEVRRLQQSNFIGNIKSFELSRWIQDNQFLEYLDKECCYYIYYSDYITYVSNSCAKCFMCTNSSEICNVDELSIEFDKLNDKYEICCENCHYPDCMGYIWLTEEEADRLCENDIEVLEVNECVNFIHSFQNGDEIDLSQEYPKCIHRDYDTGKCKIHCLRPLVCHMYPLGPETHNGNHVWALHKDCLFVQSLIQNGYLSDYVCDAKKIISRISTNLRDEIYEIYNNVDYLASFPSGENNYICIREL